MKTITILAIIAILAGTTIVALTGFSVIGSVLAQTDNATMGNMTGGNMTGGNMTEMNMTGGISSKKG